ncbi:hypothetical protein SAMN00777080_3726 [Aquiflexum balticum DSM 16537]|uniref:Abortive infection C-terminus n=1 Tax=Aquiflexum balticum DSM 16537 TaxID=758820 RepID=A0A1W2H8F0_9BACT|nr:hypothetical protein [Aquiflexum balticum]SMD45084.1 hypothetical protein SAMN00777080_3726 [Aquiflexum balticum DSM 16537]
MATYNTYSKRNNSLPDVFRYDILSSKLKSQIFHIWNKYFNQECYEDIRPLIFKNIYQIICEEEGVKNLHTNSPFGMRSNEVEIEDYFEKTRYVEKELDIIEIVFHKMTTAEDVGSRQYNFKPFYFFKDAVIDLNQRFRENGVGYEYSNGKIIRVDNKLLHRESVQETLQLLTEPEFENANEEYLNALSHCRNGRKSESLNDCLKAFESTMKIICKIKGFSFNDSYTAKPLINTLLSNKFIPEYQQSQFNAIKQLLESSVPTIRNKNSGHGQGAKKINISEPLVNYMIYLTGSTIRYLIENLKEE